jgi:hypothetical protein
LGSLRNLEPPTTGWLMPFTVPMEKTSSALVCKINARLARTAKALGNVNIDVPAKYLHRRDADFIDVATFPWPARSDSRNTWRRS